MDTPRQTRDSSFIKAISGYIKYNHWANEKMAQWLKTLASDLLYKEMTSSFASIDRTMQHLNHAQNFWYAVITEADIAKLDETIKVNSADAVIDELLAGSQQMIDTYTTYSEAELLKKVKSPFMAQSRYDAMLHVVNHNSYHRGQVITMSRYLGVINDLPETCYEAFLRSYL